jgi:hypothetical protein
VEWCFALNLLEGVDPTADIGFKVTFLVRGE